MLPMGEYLATEGNAYTRGTPPTVWGAVPLRNKNFTGRQELINDLRARMTGEEVTALLPHALQGLGGVGKTQLAIEYAYRYASSYKVVWWIPADQPALARASLATLAPRLGLVDLDPRRPEDAVAAALDALRQGEPYASWLLIFDNADQPEAIEDLIPSPQSGGPGHVLVTSRNHRWKGIADAIEVDVFARNESLEFLSRRVEMVAGTAADQLALELGDLPLALEQAGALMAETGMAMDAYLRLLKERAGKLLAENPPAEGSGSLSVAAVWSLSMARLSEETPLAWELLRRCAFFGPEPIPRDVFERGAYALDQPLQSLLLDSIEVSRAMRGLGRYALAKIDNNRRTLQVHRLIQRVIRDDLTADEAARYRRDVHLLLQVADPNDPEAVEKWPQYEELLAHIGPSEAIKSTEPGVRRLVRNLASYLYRISDFNASGELIDEALEQWTADSGEESADVLELNRQKADVLWARGEYHAAYELRRPTVERMRQVFGENDERTLRIVNGYGADLRARGQFHEALASDEDSLRRHERVFGTEQLDTILARNNLSVDYELTGQYSAARELDERNYEEARDLYGRDEHLVVAFTISALSRDLRHEGKYLDALTKAEQAAVLYHELVRQKTTRDDHAWVLAQYRDLSIVQRLSGQVGSALDGARDAYERYRRSALEDNHPDTLAAAINLGNALRLASSLGIPGGDLEGGVQLLRETVYRYTDRWVAEHPFAHAGNINLAVAQFAVKDFETALSLLTAANKGLERSVGAEHHYTLVCATNLATALAELNRPEEARVIGEETWPKLVALLGSDHPHTLACVGNLALDRAKTGVEGADELRKMALERSERGLGLAHFDVATMRDGGRISTVIEPPPV